MESFARQPVTATVQGVDMKAACPDSVMSRAGGENTLSQNAGSIGRDL